MTILVVNNDQFRFTKKSYNNNKYIHWKAISTSIIIIILLPSHFKQNDNNDDDYVVDNDTTRKNK